MKLTENQKREINDIMSKMDCDKDFQCYKSRFEDLCPVRQQFETSLIECQAAKGKDCPMSYTFAGNMLLCKCQLRRYVARRLGR